MTRLYALWSKVNEPRIIAGSHALVYFALLNAGAPDEFGWEREDA